MDQQVIAFLAFSVGVLLGYLLQWPQARDWKRKLSEQLPTKCRHCKTWHQRKSMRYALLRHHGWVDMCKNCYHTLYNPLSKGKEK